VVDPPANQLGSWRQIGRRREQVVLALLTAWTITDAAAQCGVNERTLRRWMTEDSRFQAEYDRARTATFQLGLHRVEALMGRAVDALDDLLTATKTPAVQLGAARTITELALHQHEVATILRRLTGSRPPSASAIRTDEQDAPARSTVVRPPPSIGRPWS
jgi:hypothetical protein